MDRREATCSRKHLAGVQGQPPKGAGFPPAGSKSKSKDTASKDSLSEQLLKKQIAEAEDNPERKEHLEAALAAVTAKKTHILEEQRTPCKGPTSQTFDAGEGNCNQDGSEDQTDLGGCGFPRSLARRIGRGLS
eukprot:2725643-Amphidinium_carterae.2